MKPSRLGKQRVIGWTGLGVALGVIGLVVASFGLTARTADAAPGAVWTTTGSCGDPQDANHYQVGDEIFINGSGFAADTHDWTITGQPGGASSDPGVVVAQGDVVVGASGEFCFSAYTVQPGDDGEYTVDVAGGKNDNYRVEGEGGSADTDIVKTGPASIGTGDSGSYTVTVTNNGTAATAADIVVGDTLPDGLSSVSASGTGWTCNPANITGPTSSDSITCTFSGILDQGDSAAFSVGFTAPESCESFSNTAAITADETEAGADTAENTSTVVTDCVTAGSSLTIRKVCDPTTDPGLFDILVGGQIFGTGDEVACGAGTGTVAVDPGAYVVSETADDETDIGDYDVAFSGDCDSEGNVTVAAEQDAACVITNTLIVVEPELGSITIAKDTDPETNTPTFDFDGDLGDIDLADDGSETFSGLEADDYSVTENEPTGWNLDSISCPGADVDVSLGAETVVIHLAAGQDVTCTFNNDQIVEATQPQEEATPTNTPVPTNTPLPTVTSQVAGIQVTPTQPVAPVAQVQTARALPSTGNGGYAGQGSDRYVWVVFVGALALASMGAMLLLRRKQDQE